MAIKSPKNKGASGERELAELVVGWLREVGLDAKLERNLEQVRHGGADIDGFYGVEIEVKRVESNSINSWWAQVCKAASRTRKIPLLAHRRNRQPWRFRVATHVAVYNDRVEGIAFPLVVDLEADQAKLWIQSYALQNREHFGRYENAPPPPPPGVNQ